MSESVSELVSEPVNAPVSDAVLLRCDALSLSTRAAAGPVAVLRDLSFGIAPGRVVGLVGESGAGKSMIGRVIAGLLPPGFAVSHGRVLFDGADLGRMAAADRRALLGRRIAFIPQEPLTALNPVATIGDTFGEHLARLGVAAGARAARIRAELAAVRLPAPDEIVRRYPHQLSGGQCQRVLIALAHAARPALIVADEPTTALDVVSQSTVLRLLAESRRQHGTAVLLITHDLRLAAHVCDEVIVLYAGEVVEQGPAAAVLRQPRHPYTRALHDATPDLTGERRRLPALAGRMPGIGALGRIAGCRFAARCPTAAADCIAAPPPLREVAPGHRARCIAACETGRAGPKPLPAGGDRVTAAAAVTLVVPPVADPGAVPIVELRGIGLRYAARRGLFGARRGVTDAVAEVSFAIRPGEFVGLVGESGSGKSSIARLIVGARQPTAGTLWLEGRPCDGATAAEAARRRRIVQMIFQDPHSALNPRRTVARLLTQVWEAEGAGPGGGGGDGSGGSGERGGGGAGGGGSGAGHAAAASRRAARVRELLADVGLPASLAPRFPAQLSGGQKQRVNIGRALCTTPRLLVADEIVSGLDVSVQAQVLNLLLELGRRHGVAVLLISHDLSVVRYLCSRVIVMQRGRIVEQGATEAVFAAPAHPYTRLLLASVPPADASRPWPPELALEEDG
ncbi:MAG: dipeptide ABC transporter ATP-binding protein [Lautropia sp.]